MHGRLQEGLGAGAGVRLGVGETKEKGWMEHCLQPGWAVTSGGGRLPHLAASLGKMEPAAGQVGM